MSRAAAWLAILALAASGCVTYDRGVLAAVSTVELPLEMTVVQERTEGRICRDLLQGGFRRALDLAVRLAPTANALVDASYHFEQLCLVVRGTAVRLPEPEAGG